MTGVSKFFFEVISPDGIFFQGEVSEVSLPTPNGEITILPNHASLVTKLAEGEIKIYQDEKEKYIAITGGFLEVKDNKVMLLSDYAVRTESIEIAKTEERKRRAEEKVKEKVDNTDFIIAEKDLRRSILELKVAQNVKKRHRNT